MCLLAVMALVAATTQNVGWIAHADPELQHDAQWALDTWSDLLAGTTPRPMSFRVLEVGQNTILGTFRGCTRIVGDTGAVCDITIDPSAFPAMVRVTLMHEIGHALGFNGRTDLRTPFGTIEAEFGSRSQLWVDGAHWSEAGAGLLMHPRIASDATLSAAAVVAIATHLGGAAKACTQDSDCRASQVCAPRDWPKPHGCTRAPDLVGATVLGIITAATSSISLLILL